MIDAMGKEKVYPDFMTRFVDADPAYICSRIGVQLDAGSRFVPFSAQPNCLLQVFSQCVYQFTCTQQHTRRILPPGHVYQCTHCVPVYPYALAASSSLAWPIVP